MDFREAYEDTRSTVSHAIRINDYDLARSLVEKGFCVDAFDNRGWRPLHEAAVLKQASCVQFIQLLLQRESVDVNWRTHEGETALLLACTHNVESNAFSIVRLLLEHGADPNMPDNEEETPLLRAARSGFNSVLNLLVKQGLVDINKGDFGGWSPLHEAATRGDLEMTETLTAAGARLDVKDECSMTPLFTAAQHGRIDCLKLLIKAAVERGQSSLTDEAANDGATPLMIAAQQGFTQVVEMLIACGADPNKSAKDGVNGLHLASECGHPDCIKLLMKHMDIAAMEQKLKPELNSMEIRNPIHLAVSNGKIECVTALVECGFYVDSIDCYFENKFCISSPRPKYITGLGLAVSLNAIDIATLLLNNKASVNAIHQHVFAPLHCVFQDLDVARHLRSTNLKIMKLLLDNGADVNYVAGQNVTNELVRSIFKPKHFHLLLQHGMDTKSCFTAETCVGRRFIEPLFREVTLNWLNKYALPIAHSIDRAPSARLFFTVLSERCDTALPLRYGEVYCSAVWVPIKDLFETPHSLKELCRSEVRRLVYRATGNRSDVFLKRIHDLPIPQLLKEYLSFL